MLKRTLYSIYHLIFVMLIIAVALQACQLDNSSPTASTPTVAVSPIASLTQTSTPTANPSPTIHPATATVLPITSTPSPGLGQRIDQVLIDGVEWYVVIEPINGERLYARNTEESFAPASMIKIPTALVVLKILEFRGDTVEDIKNYGIGRNFADLVEAMVIRSEEQATESLEYFARGENRLRNYLDWWGLKHTTFDPRRSTVEDLLLSLKLLNTQEALNKEFSDYLLELMSTYTENDEILLGAMLAELPQCTFYNKRGTLLNPTIVSDMGILKCGDQSWYLVIAGTPSINSSATFDDIQQSIERFALVIANYIQTQVED